MREIERLRRFIREVTVPEQVTARREAEEIVDRLEAELETRTEPPYPHEDGDVLVIGPEVFSSTAEPQADTVISWRGENFTVQTRPGGWIDADAVAAWLAERARTIEHPTAEALADEFGRTWIVGGAPDPDEAAEGTSSLSRMTDAVDIDAEIDDDDPTGPLEGPGRVPPLDAAVLVSRLRQLSERAREAGFDAMEYAADHAARLVEASEPPNVHRKSGDPAGVFDRDAANALRVREALRAADAERVVALQRRWIGSRAGSAQLLSDRYSAAVPDDGGNWIVVKSRFTPGGPVTGWLNEQLGLIEQQPQLAPEVMRGVMEVAADVARRPLANEVAPRFDDAGVIGALGRVVDELHRARVVVEASRIARARSRALLAQALDGAVVERIHLEARNLRGVELVARVEDGRRYKLTTQVAGQEECMLVEELPAGGPTDYFEPPSELDIWHGGYDAGQDDAKDNHYGTRHTVADAHARWHEEWAREHGVDENDKGEVIG